MTEHTVDYLLGTTGEELARLGFQHNVWHAEAERLWQLGGFKAGQSLVDLGCGPGFATLDLAKLAGDEGHVHAVDTAGNYLQFLGHKLAEGDLENVSLQQGDVDALELEDSCIDGVFARWLFCFLSDPARVIAEAQRVMRPGATLVIWDYFNYLAANFFPQRDSLAGLFEAFEKSNNRRGGTYYIGGQLPGLLISAGFKIIALEPMCKVIQPGTPMWQWFTLFKDGFAPGLVAEGLLSEDDFQQIDQDFNELASLKETILFPPPQIGIVARKPL